jgi:hypothetical protein
MQQESLVSAYAPPFKIVLKYFFAAILSFIILNFLLMLNYSDIQGFHFQPMILALTHIATLGWITMMIFGAMFQLVPVVLEVKLFSEKLAEIQFWIFLIGIIGLVTGFWNFDTGIHLTASAIVLNIAVLIFSFNILATMAKVKKWNIMGMYLAAAIFYLITTAFAGLLLSINLGFPFIKISHLQYLNLHAHVAFVGWVSMVIMGVSFKLIPMFTLAHDYSVKSGTIAFWLINLGLLGISSVMHFENLTLYFYISAALIATGIFFFLFQMYVIFKKRMRKKADVSIKFSKLAYTLLAISAMFGLLITFTNIANEMNVTLIYGYLIIFGYISMLIVGQMYKIMPFLVWYHKYSSKVGMEPVPMLKDMFKEKFAETGYYFMITALAGVIFSFAFQIQMGLLISFGTMLLASIIFLYNFLYILLKA